MLPLNFLCRSHCELDVWSNILANEREPHPHFWSVSGSDPSRQCIGVVVGGHDWLCDNCCRHYWTCRWRCHNGPRTRYGGPLGVRRLFSRRAAAPRTLSSSACRLTARKVVPGWLHHVHFISTTTTFNFDMRFICNLLHSPCPSDTERDSPNGGRLAVTVPASRDYVQLWTLPAFVNDNFCEEKHMDEIHTYKETIVNWKHKK